MKTESKHTPGPWHIQSSGTWGTNGFYQFTITDARGMEIVNTKQHVLGRTYPELIANSKLIAVAPELLEACKTAFLLAHPCPECHTVEVMDNGKARCLCADRPWEWSDVAPALPNWAEIREAIAKAEGRE